jgi:hypothetical protein
MAKQIDYQILLQEVVRTAKAAAQEAVGKADADSRILLFAYHDILDVVKTQAEVMEVPLSEIGLEGYDVDALVAAQADPDRRAA